MDQTHAQEAQAVSSSFSIHQGVKPGYYSICGIYGHNYGKTYPFGGFMVVDHNGTFSGLMCDVYGNAFIQGKVTPNSVRFFKHYYHGGTFCYYLVPDNMGPYYWLGIWREQEIALPENYEISFENGANVFCMIRLVTESTHDLEMPTPPTI